jgi:hypothetical protein
MKWVMAQLEHNPRRGAGWRVRALAGAALGLLLLGAVGAPAQAQNAGVPEGTVSRNAQTGSIGPGTVTEVLSSETSYIPTPAQIAAHERVMANKWRHVPPPLGPHTTALQVRGPGGTPTAAMAEEAATSFTVFKTSLINSTCSGCAQATVNEPTAANSGKTVVETSNWNIAYTLNGGAPSVVWGNLSPYSLSTGFCCDQEVVYNADRNIFLLLQLDYVSNGNSANGLALSIAHGLSPTSWCTYKFTGASFGLGATDLLDFPKIAVSNNNAFLTWNDYNPSGAWTSSGLARFPLDSLASCAGFSFNFLNRGSEFTFALARTQTAHDQFYWVSNWMTDGTVNGQNLRIFWWPDNSGTYFWVTKGVNAYTFGTAACNWCGRLDPRYESVVITPAEYRAQANSAFAGDQILEVATTAGPSSFSNGNNYVVYNYFKLNSLAYIGNDQTFNTTNSFGYPGCNVNAKGYVGCAMVQGVNPGGLIVLQDNVNPTQPWGYDFVIGGINSNNSWGDYVETNPWIPGGGPFQTVLWNLNGSTVQPYYIVWGRGSDANDYGRWKSR